MVTVAKINRNYPKVKREITPGSRLRGANFRRKKTAPKMKYSPSMPATVRTTHIASKQIKHASSAEKATKGLGKWGWGAVAALGLAVVGAFAAKLFGKKETDTLNSVN